MSRSVQQAAENEATFRLANESLKQKADEFDLVGERTPYLCECEDEHCTRVIQLSREEYERIRQHPTRFVMVPGHQETRDRVVREEAGFTVIEKSGEDGELVARLDPRSASG
jgi:hypothetical protein